MRRRTTPHRRCSTARARDVTCSNKPDARYSDGNRGTFKLRARRFRHRRGTEPSALFTIFSASLRIALGWGLTYETPRRKSYKCSRYGGARRKPAAPCYNFQSATRRPQLLTNPQNHRSRRWRRNWLRIGREEEEEVWKGRRYPPGAGERTRARSRAENHTEEEEEAQGSPGSCRQGPPPRDWSQTRLSMTSSAESRDHHPRRYHRRKTALPLTSTPVFRHPLARSKSATPRPRRSSRRRLGDFLPAATGDLGTAEPYC